MIKIKEDLRKEYSRMGSIFKKVLLLVSLALCASCNTADNGTVVFSPVHRAGIFSPESNIGAAVLLAATHESNLSKKFKPENPARLIVVVVDGMANSRNVIKMWKEVRDVAKKRGFIAKDASGKYLLEEVFLEGGTSMDKIESVIKNKVKAYKKKGIPKKKLALLLIGKSIGSVKQYKLMRAGKMYDSDMRSGLLSKFWKVGWVLIDPHEPGNPGDDGKCSKGYDYAKFDCNRKFNTREANNGRNKGSHYYNLEILDRWVHWIKKGQLRINSTYQRNDGGLIKVKGYPLAGGFPAGNSPKAYYSTAIWRQKKNDHSKIDKSCVSARLIWKTMKWFTEDKKSWTPLKKIPYSELKDTKSYADSKCAYD